MSLLLNFKESVVVECKLALGRDGNGAIPNDFWETYSAFANTYGGTIYLGVKENNGEFSVQGIPSPERLKTDLFSTLNNPKKVSCNLLSDKDVIIEEIDNKKILVIKVPQASRQQRPVYINENFFTGTFRRLHDGDRKCSEESVKRMLAEQIEDSRDSKILQNYTLDDFNHETIDAYRQMFANYKPDHPWNVPNKLEFLRLSGCWRKERSTGEEGFTLAGVLMFGTWNAIMDICPFLFWDYQELPENLSTHHRWIDRIVFDGTWSGNLFDFYRKVSLKLLSDLKKPFLLKDGIRQDDTPQHTALREALINALVHADYSGRASIKIQKSNHGFMFRNPGTLRLPKKNILVGGESDCRNRTIHQLFLMLGLGERAGSGLPKIKEAWEALGYEISLEDHFEPYEQTILTLKNLNFKLNEPVNELVNEPVNESEPVNEPVNESEPVNEPVNELVNEPVNESEPVNEPVNELVNFESELLMFISLKPKTTYKELANHFQKSISTIKRHLTHLKNSGKLMRIGSDKAGHWQIIETT